MLRRFVPSLLVLVGIFFAFSAPSKITWAEHGEGEMGHPHPIITHFEPLGFAPGRVMSINGGPFVRQDGIYGSRLYFSNDELPVFFESDSRLVFVPPLQTACGDHPLFIETTANVNGQPVKTKSEVHQATVQCVNLKWEGPEPRIKTFEHSGHVTAKLEPIYITGEDITPYGPQDGLPNTVAHYTMGQIVGIEELTYIEFGKASFKLNVEHCGTYTVEIRNYHRDVETYSTGKRFKVEVTNNCDGIPPIMGHYQLALKDVPAQAEAGRAYTISVSVGYNGAFPVDADLTLSLNDAKLASQPITAQPKQTKIHQFEVQFPAAGSYKVTAQIGDYSISAQVEVTGPAAPDLLPPSGGNLNEQLRQFDTDGDCYIGNTEFFVLLERWSDGTIEEALYYAAIDVWNSQTSICTRAAGIPSELQVQKRPHALLFSASTRTTALDLVIYDTNGRLVHKQRSDHNRLAWNLRDRSNSPVANGVYLVRVIQTLSDGTKEHSLKKVMVMR